MFISYAQNFEDVYLHRLFGDRERGTYVDVGAFSPVEHSVTKVFYDRGWRGINIEPVASLFVDFVSERPDDINLQVAVAAQESRRTIFSIPDSGLSSLVREHAVSAQLLHRFDAAEEEVTCRTLDGLWDEYLQDTVVQFLKIDVEGLEREVLEGGARVLAQALAEVVIVEAIEPTTTRPVFEQWEHLLLQARYTFAWFDGVNRWYLSPGMSDRADRLAVPVNCFDDVVPVHLAEAIRGREIALQAVDSARRAADAAQQTVATIERSESVLSSRAADLENRLQLCSTELAECRAERDRARADLDLLKGSTSWRLTKPVRALTDRVRQRR